MGMMLLLLTTTIQWTMSNSHCTSSYTSSYCHLEYILGVCLPNTIVLFGNIDIWMTTGFSPFFLLFSCHAWIFDTLIQNHVHLSSFHSLYIYKCRLHKDVKQLELLEPPGQVLPVPVVVQRVLETISFSFIRMIHLVCKLDLLQSW